MTSTSKIRGAEIAVVGAGLVGSLLSIYLARRNFHVDIFERRPDMRLEKISAGRSINLAVSTRGLLALRNVGLEEEVLKQAIPMRGRMLHSKTSELTFLRYGKDDSECINSVSRAALNKLLMSKAEETKRVKIHFNHKTKAIDLKKGEIIIDDDEGIETFVGTDMVYAADGSGSVIRDDMMKLDGYTATESELNYGYKELLIPPGKDGSFQMEKHALHIWPRGNFMLIALPNYDGSYTCTLFLPFEGNPSFETLKNAEQVQKFFEEQFPDAVPLMSDLTETFFANPTGHMTTVKCYPWNCEERALLLGDAAHAIVPFFGQGMNAGFEDLTVLNECMNKHVREGGSLYVNRRKRDEKGQLIRREGRRMLGSTSWSRIFSEFVNQRKANTDAIADMAVENFIEMRDKCADTQFQLEKAVEKVLQRQFPNEYRSRYSLVTFSNIPYSVAMKAGLAGDEVLKELCKNLEDPEKIDFKRAQKLISSKLSPILKEHQHELKMV